MQSFPVKLATPPFASTIPTCRWSRPSSSARSFRRTASAERPFLRRRSPDGPKVVLPAACVAMAPTSASAQGTTEPTAKNRDCTATPRSPLAGSKPTMEKVEMIGASPAAGATAKSKRRETTARSAARDAEDFTNPAPLLVVTFGFGVFDLVPGEDSLVHQRLERVEKIFRAGRRGRTVDRLVHLGIDLLRSQGPESLQSLGVELDGHNSSRIRPTGAPGRGREPLRAGFNGKGREEGKRSAASGSSDRIRQTDHHLSFIFHRPADTPGLALLAGDGSASFRSLASIPCATQPLKNAGARALPYAPATQSQ